MSSIADIPSSAAARASLTLLAAQPRLPIRLSLLSYNLWNTEHLEKRTSALEDFFQRFDADIICLQEVRPQSLALLDKFLPTHARIAEQKEEPGWMCEGNIYYRTALFSLLEFGAVDIGMKAKGSARRQWWANLQLKATGHKIHVSTVHYTWEGHIDELTTGFSPRVEYAHATVKFLQQQFDKVDALFFCGDFNDRYHPRRILQKANLIDTMSQLALPMPTTWPTPSWNWNEDPLGAADFSCDWIFTCNRVKTLMSQVLNHSRQGVHPSDHFPVMTMFQIKDEQPKEFAGNPVEIPTNSQYALMN